MGRKNGNGNANAIPGVDNGVSHGLDGCIEHGKLEKDGPAKVLPRMRDIISKEKVHDWPAGGPWAVLEENILRNWVPSKGASQGWGNPQTDHDAPGKEVQRDMLRVVRGYDQTSHSSCGREYPEQHCGKLDDRMCALPQQDSFRADRIKALGNAVVPQIPELIGRAILTAEASQ